MTEIHQINITRQADGEYKIVTMKSPDGVVDDELCPKGAVIPMVAALLSLLVSPESKP